MVQVLGLVFAAPLAFCNVGATEMFDSTVGVQPTAPLVESVLLLALHKG